MAKIEFFQPKPRIEDWRVKLNGRTIGSVWRAGEAYITNVTGKAIAATKEAAFKVARKQAKSVTAA
ncbi:MAG: hypothetical protein IT468_01580 [Rhodocyclaceae bacterium]|nr:hypothetical protein [Rhodocyclaceae bacterium]